MGKATQNFYMKSDPKFSFNSDPNELDNWKSEARLYLENLQLGQQLGVHVSVKKKNPATRPPIRHCVAKASDG